jgi:membrane fusion protein (multidrug efflux system)
MVASVLALSGLNACSKPSEAQEAAKVFPVAHPQRSGGEIEHGHVGEVQAVRRVELRARIKGWVESLLIDEGQTVAEGQVLFKISARELQQELRRQRAVVASAAAELKSAEIERTNTRPLRDKGVVSSAELALLDAKILALKAKLDEARAGEGAAEINLSYAEVKAPFAGVVNRIPFKAGSMVDEGALLTTLTDTSEVFVYCSVSEREYLDELSSRPPVKVNFELANGERLANDGRTDALESEFDKATGTLALRARFANPNGVLRHGSTGKVVVKTQVKDALTVPLKSTFEVQDQVYAYVVDAKGTVRARRIVPSLRLQDRYVIAEGLTAEDRYVVEGLQALKEGDTIVAREQAPEITAKP